MNPLERYMSRINPDNDFDGIFGDDENRRPKKRDYNYFDDVFKAYTSEVSQKLDDDISSLIDIFS